ncbi:MAG: hypothetical protein LC648_08175 [Novosphingobium sp.]|nr:hypothetical protein [Novosphingobium sp.]
MIGDLREVLKSLNSASDWAVVGAAAIAGFVTDAAINIVPLPVFSPGVCAVTAAGAALTAKRALEARVQSTREEKTLGLYVAEAGRIADLLEARKKLAAAEALRFEIAIAKAQQTPEDLRAALERARAQL